MVVVLIDRVTSSEVAWTAAVLALLVAVGWYLSLSAARLDRLHHRVESSFAALRTQLVRRAAVSLEAVSVVDPSAGLVIAGAAGAAMGPWEEERAWRGEPGWSEADADEQSGLTRALVDVFGDPAVVAGLREDVLARDTLDELANACTRVQIARRFHNDAVAAARRRRRKRVVRWFRLAGRAPAPAMVDFDDSVPAGLARSHPGRPQPTAGGKAEAPRS